MKEKTTSRSDSATNNNISQQKWTSTTSENNSGEQYLKDSARSEPKSTIQFNSNQNLSTPQQINSNTQTSITSASEKNVFLNDQKPILPYDRQSLRRRVVSVHESGEFEWFCGVELQLTHRRRPLIDSILQKSYQIKSSPRLNKKHWNSKGWSHLASSS